MSQTVKPRYLTTPIQADLQEKMVFVAGPRQVGKTTLANQLVSNQIHPMAYFNWDRAEDRKRILSSIWPADAKLIVLDEIHKYRLWKRFIKGEYDHLKNKFKFLVTGSARLDVFRRGGDSLQGRYHYYRLHPFTLAEWNSKDTVPTPFQELQFDNHFYDKELDVLEKFGGFPEPLMRHDERFLRRWHSEKNERLIREDIRDLELIRDIGHLQLLRDQLPSRVGSLLSVNALREDLEVSHKAVVRWLTILETFYYAYRIYPYSRLSFRSIKKEPKLYLWDWSEVEEKSARFENLVANHLLKFVHFLHDHDGHKAELSFIRDSTGKEVDFLVTIDKKPWFAVEAKLEETDVSSSLKYVQERLHIPFVFQVVRKRGVDELVHNVRVMSASRFLAALI